MRWSVVLTLVAGGGAALAAAPAVAPAFRVVGLVTVVGVVIVVLARRRRAPEPATPIQSDSETSIGVVDLYRRRTIRMLGLGVLGAAPVMAVSGLLNESAGRGRFMDWAPADLVGAAKTADGRIRQWAMIVDLRYCDGCQASGTPPACTTACIEGHYAPEPMEWIEVYEGDLAGGGTQFIPTPCQQCQNPPCVNVCPVGATFSSPEGTVLIDQNRCIGCRICMAACPYDRRFFNWANPPVPPDAILADYSPDTQIPASRGTVMKCDFCPDMVRSGTLPFCIQACPNRAIWYGDLEENVATNGREIVSASRFLNEASAFRLKENLGTEPRVYYIPGHGELVGRDPYTSGREPTEWPWLERAEGSKTWSR